ncbi:hypothetical protein FFI89_000140 [Bradyrhizobium sp. KBS0727]|uniref:hypothetical protein n=1 Tax=unclassified Bradyrhizobium TaxID=2631580 RepID=UPI00110D8383|nr:MULTISPECIES: hypothetical protein [unclassified Bradyrhizobium]QDW35685.1 hypothetical protein FFI71_000140 [Bradyrhizobium sp. KBS0725]QDW42286.1 hypothetical protein FFI89_000140 [Bradyrhizobium sp. KBS0727]
MGARQLYEALTSGELVNASTRVKMIALAWCGRFSEIESENGLYEVAIDAALRLGDCDEIRIAKAFRTSRNDKSAALSDLQGIGTPASRSASFIIISRAGAPNVALTWFRQAGLDISSLDPDGKFYLIQKCFEADCWDDAFNFAKLLDDSDFDQAPVLLHVAANARLAKVIPGELKAMVLQQIPLESLFPLADDADSMEQRRSAQTLYERVIPVASALGCEQVAQLTSDRVLWLKLRDPIRHFGGGSRQLRRLR